MGLVLHTGVFSWLRNNSICVDHKWLIPFKDTIDFLLTNYVCPVIWNWTLISLAAQSIFQRNIPANTSILINFSFLSTEKLVFPIKEAYICNNFDLSLARPCGMTTATSVLGQWSAVAVIFVEATKSVSKHLNRQNV